ncbi:MAG: threonine--tRNA ligase [Candidatus Bilamarchaeaceae archaeon]
MRILTVHADYIEVETREKAIADAEKSEHAKTRKDEVLVVFSAVEEGDEDVAGTACAAADEIRKVADQVKTKNVYLYPLVHLTSKPSSPRVAFKVLLKTEEQLKKSGYEADHAPFGWYKGYTLKCKGHPLSELSRELHGKIGAEGAIHGTETEEGGKAGGLGDGKPETEVSASLKQESAMKSRFCILDPDGTLTDVEGYRPKGTKDSAFMKLVTYETKKVRAYEKEPPHIKLMKEQGLVHYEPGSDPGNFRFHPKGRLVKKLLEKAINDYCIDDGAMEVETPIMYDFEHPTLKKYLNRFPARQYVVLSEDRRLFLRFAACFGQFLMAHDTVMSYRQLPLKMYELTRYSFRREQSGELAGLKRLRGFTMPDMHTFCRNVEQAKTEFQHQLEMGLKWNDGLGLDTEVAFRVQSDFFEEHKAWYVGMVKRIGKPVMLELFKERYAYFITKFEFNFIDAMDKASTLTTVQIDVENADTYDITYVDEDGQKKRPLILHASISGSLERVIYALLEKEAMKMAQGKKAMLPLWLAPTQVRIVPISAEQKEKAVELMKSVSGVRVDVDDRDDTLGKKIRDAEKEWVPYIAVLGKNEAEKGTVMVNIRETGEKKEMTLEELAGEIRKKTEGTPFEKGSMNPLVSMRPVI